MLLRVLGQKQSTSIRDLAAQFHTRRETIYRDLRVLQDAGYPIAGDEQGRLSRPRLLASSVPNIQFSPPELEALLLAAQTYKNLCTITKALRPEFGDRKASSITADELKKWLRIQDAKRDWADGTYNGYVTQLCVIFGLGIKHKKISENSAKEIKLRTLHNGKPRYLSPDEANRFETTIKELFPQHWEAFQFARFIGFRASAQFKLKWTQVDLQQRKISLPPIRRSKYKKWRDFPMNSIVYAIILDRWNRTSDHRGYVFAEYHQGPEYLLKPAYWFPEIVEAAGVEDFTWHSLRHDFISQLVMKGVNLKTVMDLAGHANLKQTAKYAALAPTTLAESSELLTTATVTATAPNPDYISGNEVPPKLPLAVLA